MIGLVKFLQTIKLNSKECPSDLHRHCRIPLEQRMLKEAKVTKDRKPLETVVT